MRVLVKIYAGVKYTSNEKPFKIEMDIDAFKVRKISDETMMKRGWAKEDLDEHKEYLLIKLACRDEVSIYRNSHIDIFKI